MPESDEFAPQVEPTGEFKKGDKVRAQHPDDCFFYDAKVVAVKEPKSPGAAAAEAPARRKYEVQWDLADGGGKGKHMVEDIYVHRRRAADPMKTVETQLTKLIGMPAFKEQVRSHARTAVVAKRREKKRAKNGGPAIKSTPMHFTLSGNPGTGKTTAAGALCEILYDCGVIEAPRVKKAVAADLIAGFTGQSALKTVQKVREAVHGLLVVDEAHTLHSTDQGSFETKAVQSMVKEMETSSTYGGATFVLAGYAKPLGGGPNVQDVVRMDDGFTRRFKVHLQMDNYTVEEIAEIAMKMFTSEGYTLSGVSSEYIADKLREFTDEMWRAQTNGGLAQKVVDLSKEKLDDRALEQALPDDKLDLILKEDIDAGFSFLQRPSNIPLVATDSADSVPGPGSTDSAHTNVGGSTPDIPSVGTATATGAAAASGGFRVPDTKTLGRGDYDEKDLKGKTLEELEDLVRGIEVEGDAARGYTAKAIGKLPTGTKYPNSATTRHAKEQATIAWYVRWLSDDTWHTDSELRTMKSLKRKAGDSFRGLKVARFSKAAIAEAAAAGYTVSSDSDDDADIDDGALASYTDHLASINAELDAANSKHNARVNHWKRKIDTVVGEMRMRESIAEQESTCDPGETAGVGYPGL